MAADFEMRKAASSILSSISDYAKEHPGMVAGMLGAGGIGALGGALYGDEDDDDRSTGARVMRRVKNALIGGALGAGSMAALGYGINMLRGKSTTSTHNGTTPPQEMTNTAAAPVGGSVPADNTQHADKGEGGGVVSFIADAAGPVGWTTGGVVTGVGSGKAVGKWLGRGEEAAANRLVDMSKTPGSALSGLDARWVRDAGSKARQIETDLRQYLNPHSGGGQSGFGAVSPDEFLKSNLKGDLALYNALPDDAAKRNFLQGRNLLEGFDAVSGTAKDRARLLAKSLTPDQMSQLARTTDVSPLLAEMNWKGNVGNKLKLHGLNSLRRIRKAGGPIAGSLVGAATTFGIPALMNAINENLEED